MSSFGHFRVAVLPKAGLFELNVSVSGELKVVGGYEAKLLDMLSQGLRMRYSVVVPTDMEWGRLKKNGNWTGTIGMIHRNKADMAVSWLGMTEERARVVDFSYPYYTEDVTFAVQQPASMPTSLALIRPIYSEIWILATILVILPFVFRLAFTKKYSLMKLFLRIWGSLLKQPLGIPVNTFKEKLLFVAWLFTSLFTSCAYTAVLLAFLTFPTRERGIQTINELYEAVVREEYKCAIYKGSIFMETLMKSRDHRLQTIGHWISKNKGFIEATTEEVFSYIKGGRSAIIAPRINIRDVLHDIAYVSSDSFYSGAVAVAFSKKLKIKAKLDDVILRVRAGGFYEKSLNDRRYLEYLNYLKTNKFEMTNGSKQLSSKDLFSAFAMLICGILLATAVFAIELIWNYFPRFKDP